MIGHPGRPLLSGEYGPVLAGATLRPTRIRANTYMIDTFGLGIKGGLLLAAGAVAAYLLFTWLRLRQIRKRKAKAAAAKPARQRKTQAPVEMDTDALDEGEDDEQLDAVIYTRPRPAPQTTQGTVARPEPMAADPGFAALLGESRERQVPVKSAEVQALREEVAALRQALADMQDEMERMKAAQTVSPLYNEAVGLAQHGIDAEGIAARCGISIAEAQLVAALASRQDRGDMSDDFYEDDFGTERQHGTPGQRYAAA